MSLFAQFKAFAKSMPRDEKYDDFDNQNCAVAQFAKSVDPSFLRAGYIYYVRLVDGTNDEVVMMFNGKRQNAYYDAVMCSKTWGTLADKLEGIVE